MKKETFRGRLNERPLYQADVPFDWKRIDYQDLSDTKNPIVAFETSQGTVTVHNFPNIKIPPEAQIARWKEQMKGEDYEIYPVSHGGFGGFCIEGTSTIAYAMQLTPLLYSAITDPDQKADYTIKFTGEKKIDKEEIAQFAMSFEWIFPFPFERL